VLADDARDAQDGRPAQAAVREQQVAPPSCDLLAALSHLEQDVTQGDSG
jgi:hypothetical protein